MVVTLIFILFRALIFNMFIKLNFIRRTFDNFLIHIFTTFLFIVFRIYYFLTFGCLFSLTIILLLYFVFYTFLVCFNSNDYNLSSDFAFFHVYTDTNKGNQCLQSHNNDSLNNLWLIFAILFFSLKFDLIREVT